MLLKGCHKRMICVKSPHSRLFCEAFFVLREEESGAGERDMLAEANRIIEEDLLASRRRERRTRRRLLSALPPFAFGALAASLVWFLATAMLYW